MWGVAGGEDKDGRLDMSLDPTARRFDMGERSDFCSLPPAHDAIAQLVDWQRNGAGTAAAVQPMVEAIAEEARTRGWAVPEEPAPHMIGIRAPGGWPTDLVGRLWTEHMVHVSVRGPCLRVSPHVYNGMRDVEALFAALGKVL